MSKHFIAACIVVTITLSAAHGHADSILTSSDPLAQGRHSVVFERAIATRWRSDVSATVFSNIADSFSVVGSVLDGPATAKSQAAEKPEFRSTLRIKRSAPTANVRVMPVAKPTVHAVSGALNAAVHAVVSRLSMIANAILAQNP